MLGFVGIFQQVFINLQFELEEYYFRDESCLDMHIGPNQPRSGALPTPTCQCRKLCSSVVSRDILEDPTYVQGSLFHIRGSERIVKVG